MSAALASVTTAVALLGWQQRRHAHRHAAARAAVFDDCRTLLDRAKTEDHGADYPRLAGRYRGGRFEVQPLLDHVGFRKHPSVWLTVSLHAALPLAGALEVLMRPQNIEFYAAGTDWEQRLELPEAWPAEHIARLDRAGWTPPLEAIRHGLEDWLMEPSFKSVLVTPRGVRLVVRLCGVRRGDYLLLRALRPDAERVPPALLERVMDAALRIAAAIHAEQHTRHQEVRP